MYVIHAWLNTKTTLSQSLQCHHYAVFHCTVFVHMLALLKFVDQNLWYLHCSIRVLKHSTFRLSMSLSSWECNQLKFDMHRTNWFKGHFPDESGQVSFSLSDEGLLAAIADASDWLDVICELTDITAVMSDTITQWLIGRDPLHSDWLDLIRELTGITAVMSDTITQWLTGRDPWTDRHHCCYVWHRYTVTDWTW